MMEAASTSKTSVNQITRRNNLEDSHLPINYSLNLFSVHFSKFFVPEPLKRGEAKGRNEGE
jgi:hypothetical protein